MIWFTLIHPVYSKIKTGIFNLIYEWQISGNKPAKWTSPNNLANPFRRQEMPETETKKVLKADVLRRAGPFVRAAIDNTEQGFSALIPASVDDPVCSVPLAVDPVVMSAVTHWDLPQTNSKSTTTHNYHPITASPVDPFPPLHHPLQTIQVRRAKSHKYHHTWD
jgi:hypothetical protein